MAGKTVEPEVIEQTTPQDEGPDTSTQWLADHEITPDMIQIPYAYLMQDGGELIKQYPGTAGQWYVAGVGVVPDGLVIVPVQAGKREETIRRDGRDNVEDVFRLRSIEVTQSLPLIMTFRGTAKGPFRALIAAMKWAGPGWERQAFRVTSQLMIGEERRSWYVPVFEALDEIEPAACKSLVDSIWGAPGVAIAPEVEGMPF